MLLLADRGPEPVYVGLAEVAARAPVEDLDRADEVWRRFAADDGGESYLDALRECVSSLDGRARRAIDLRYQDDRSRADIAAALDLGEEGVKALLRRTRDILRRCVEKRLGLDVPEGE